MSSKEVPGKPIATRRGTSDRIERALDAIESERAILTREADAFTSFRRRIQSMEADEPAASANAVGKSPSRCVGPSVVSTVERDAGPSRSPVRDAYVETVMATTHFDDEYGESYVENLTVEFGPELAQSIRASSGLPEFLKQRLLAAARDAADRRTRMLAVLDRESKALETAATELRDVREELFAIRSRPFFDCTDEELTQCRADLRRLRARCDRLAVRRQRGDLSQSVPTASSAPSLPEYLYGDVPFTHPVLGEIATVGDEVERAVSDVDVARRAL